MQCGWTSTIGDVIEAAAVEINISASQSRRPIDELRIDALICEADLRQYDKKFFECHCLERVGARIGPKEDLSIEAIYAEWLVSSGFPTDQLQTANVSLGRASVMQKTLKASARTNYLSLELSIA